MYSWYYAEQLCCLRDSMRNKRRGMLTPGVLLLHNNAPAHKAKVAMAALRDCGFEQLDHPPYSLDLAPSDYYLFRILKRHLWGKRFAEDDDVKSKWSGSLTSRTKIFLKLILNH